MYYSPTKLERLYHQLGTKNRCPIKKANQISLIYLTVASNCTLDYTPQVTCPKHVTQGLMTLETLKNRHINFTFGSLNFGMYIIFDAVIFHPSSKMIENPIFASVSTWELLVLQLLNALYFDQNCESYFLLFFYWTWQNVNIWIFIFIFKKHPHNVNGGLKFASSMTYTPRRKWTKVVISKLWLAYPSNIVAIWFHKLCSSYTYQREASLSSWMIIYLRSPQVCIWLLLNFQHLVQMHVFLTFVFGLTPTQIPNLGVRKSDKIGVTHHTRDLIFISNINKLWD
jgi:hypothetical protein